jgi:DNA repair protein RecN (Recombination protein N)
VAAHLQGLGAVHQILCVTHLAPIAARAAHHLRVAKSVEDGRTRTRVQALVGDDRMAEVADMISGGRDQATALAEARRLLAAR